MVCLDSHPRRYCDTGALCFVILANFKAGFVFSLGQKKTFNHSIRSTGFMMIYLSRCFICSYLFVTVNKA